MSTKMTATLGVCLAGGIAFGLALARPGNSGSDTQTVEGGAPGGEAPAGGYGGGAATDDQAATPAAGAGAAAAATGTITIADFAFGAPLTVAPGATVTVSNDDSAPHTVTADDGSFDTGSLDSGSAITITAPSVAGTYEFICTIHPSMTGTLSVQG